MGIVSKNILAKTGIAIFLLGLAVGLPNISSELLIDFTVLADETITLMRMGLIAAAIGVVVS